jgi:phosphatidylglycerol---prolipoprotein diacylglyceryl transferase
MILSFIWNVSPDIISVGPFQLKWVTALLVIGILAGRKLLQYVFKKEGASSSEVGLLYSLVLIGAVVGARLVYVTLIDSDILFNSPAKVLFPFEFNRGFRFIGEHQFSMLGSMVGVILTLLIYAKVKGKRFLWTLDKGFMLLIVVLVFLRAGNLFQSEYIGKATDSAAGVLFVNKLEGGLQKLPCCAMRNPDGENPLDTVQIRNGNQMLHTGVGYKPLIIYLFFKDGATEQLVNEFLIGDVKTFLFDQSRLVYEPGTEPLHYTIFVEGVANNYMTRIQTIGIARHPLQLYEAIAFLLIFIFIIRYWNKNHMQLQPGRIASLLIIFVSCFHFLIEFLNDMNRPLIKAIPFTMDQYLCIPLLIFGIVLWMKSAKAETN